VIDSGRTIRSVSCVSQALCVAVDNTGYATVLTEGATNAVTTKARIIKGLPSVSCASPTYCVAVGGAEAATFDGTTWSAPVQLETSPVEGPLDSISCPSVRFCVAEKESGEVIVGSGAQPAVTGVSPSSGPVTGGTTVTVKGRDFYDVSAVHVGAGEATIESQSETEITVLTPPGRKSVRVSVTTPAGTSAVTGKAARPAKFKYVKVPR
jgi:hypothetical protein